MRGENLMRAVWSFGIVSEFGGKLGLALQECLCFGFHVSRERPVGNSRFTVEVAYAFNGSHLVFGTFTKVMQIGKVEVLFRRLNSQKKLQITTGSYGVGA